MKKRLLVAFWAGIILVAVSCVSSAADIGPETIDLKEAFQVEGKKQAVIFPHRKHQASLACASCHKNPNGGGELVVEFVDKEGSGNDFHKKFCWPCHVEMEVPKGKSCSICHK